MTAVNPPAGSISFVVITENNVRDCDAILEVLSLGKHPIDDVIVLTRSDRVSEINTADRPWCRVIGISDASIYSLRAVIPTISQNDWLVVLEEHSLVTIATLDAIRSTIQNQSDIDLIVFLGKNLTSVSPWGWANFLHTFALIWAPIDEPPPFSPVTSVIVRRAALQTDCAFREGEWELRTIPQIFARGRIAYSNDICVDHIRRLTIISCFLINYHNARAGAGIGRGLHEHLFNALRGRADGASSSSASSDGLRIHVLDYGRTLGTGSANEMLNDPAVIAAYIGTGSLS